MISVTQTLFPKTFSRISKGYCHTCIKPLIESMRLSSWLWEMGASLYEMIEDTISLSSR